MTPGPPFSLQGLTFSVLGSTETHLWDHPGATARALGTALAHLRNQTPKKHKKITFLGPVLGPKLNDISCYFLCFFALVFTRVPSEGNEVQMSQNMQKKDAEITFFNNNSQIEKQRFDCAGASGSRVKAPRSR